MFPSDIFSKFLLVNVSLNITTGSLFGFSCIFEHMSFFSGVFKLFSASPGVCMVFNGADAVAQGYIRLFPRPLKSEKKRKFIICVTLHHMRIIKVLASFNKVLMTSSILYIRKIYIYSKKNCRKRIRQNLNLVTSGVITPSLLKWTEFVVSTLYKVPESILLFCLQREGIFNGNKISVISI